MLTWSLVVLQSNYIFGTFLETLEEIHDKISDIFSVGRLECELLIPNCDKCEGLRERLAASENKNIFKNFQS